MNHWVKTEKEKITNYKTENESECKSLRPDPSPIRPGQVHLYMIQLL